ncbi:hypothetical protein ABW21_db0203731 [Orbilia brochopaga]|nr:hypothetical protein ABW21_db0203731 [Drechslerella brochopaga]
MNPRPETPHLRPSTPVILSHEHEDHHVVLHDPNHTVCKWDGKHKSWDMWHAWHHINKDSKCQRTCWICPTDDDDGREYYTGLTHKTLEELAEHIDEEHPGFCKVCQLEFAATTRKKTPVVQDTVQHGHNGNMSNGPWTMPGHHNTGWHGQQSMLLIC